MAKKDAQTREKYAALLATNRLGAEMRRIHKRYRLSRIIAPVCMAAIAVLVVLCNPAAGHMAQRYMFAAVAVIIGAETGAMTALKERRLRAAMLAPYTPEQWQAIAKETDAAPEADIVYSSGQRMAYAFTENYIVGVTDTAISVCAYDDVKTVSRSRTQAKDVSAIDSIVLETRQGGRFYLSSGDLDAVVVRLRARIFGVTVEEYAENKQRLIYSGKYGH